MNEHHDPDHEEPGKAESSQAKLPVPVPDEALSIPKRRLAGSPVCMNCGTILAGPFCHFCGQPDKNLMRFFPVLLRELLEDFMDFDSRFMRTIKPLLFKPGKLTRDYLDGKRFRYVPPLRLYIFSSIAFFFLAAIFAGESIRVQTDGVDGDTDQVAAEIRFGETEKEELRDALEGLEDIRPGMTEEIIRNVEQAKQDSGEPTVTADGEATAVKEYPDKPSFDVNGKPWDKETNPVKVPLLPDRANAWINDEIEQSPQKGKAIEENPDLIWDKVFDVLPATMFVLLPLVALLLKFWYLFARKYYVEHLIFALHNHAFIFVVFLILIVCNVLAGWLEPSEEGPFHTALVWISAAAWIWIPVYLLISLKRVYQQGWVMTILKYSAIGISYTVLLGMITVFVAVASFVLL